MTAWQITGLFVLALFLLLQLRLRVQTEYSEEGVFVHVGLGMLRILVYPLRDKPDKAEKKKKPKDKAKRKEKIKFKVSYTSKGGMSLERVRQYIDFALQAMGACTKRLRIDELHLRLDWGLEDPADAAMYYGYANAALGGLVAILEANFTVKKRHTEIQLDYTLEKPQLYLRASCSLRLQQIFGLAFYLGLRGWRLYKSMNPREKTKVKKQDDTVKSD